MVSYLHYQNRTRNDFSSAAGTGALSSRPVDDEAGPKQSWTLTGTKCTTVKDGATTWIATGGGRTWEGVRPPEGVGYQWYTLVRKR